MRCGVGGEENLALRLEGAAEEVVEEACRRYCEGFDGWAVCDDTWRWRHGGRCCAEWWAEAGAGYCEGEVEESERTYPRLVFHLISHLLRSFFE